MLHPSTADDLLRMAIAGDIESLGRLLADVQDRLMRIIQFRMDPRLRGRLDAADVLQEASLEAMSRFDQYRSDPRMPFFVWVRFLTIQKLVEFHRRHLGVIGRDAGRDVSVDRGPISGVRSSILAAQLMGKLTSPSQAAIRAETRSRLEAALNSMEPIDREVLTLRHFEWLCNQEAAEVLGISESAASNRYVRAIKRLKTYLETRS